MLRTMADTLHLAVSNCDPLSSEQIDFARGLADDIARQPPRIARALENPASGKVETYIRVYGRGAWGRAARSIHSWKPLKNAGLITPACLACGFLQVKEDRYFAIVEEALPAERAGPQTWSDEFAKHVVEDIGRFARIVNPADLRFIFPTPVWFKPHVYLEKVAEGDDDLPPALRQAIARDAAASRTFDYGRSPIITQADIHGENLCRSPGGRPTWFDRDELHIYPTELQIANLLLFLLEGPKIAEASLFESFCGAVQTYVPAWRRLRLVHMRTLAAAKFLTRWRNPPDLSKPAAHVEAYMTRYLATHDVADRGQSDAELMGEIGEQWQRRRSG